MATKKISEGAAVVIRSLLAEIGMSQEQLAEDSGISMRTLSRRLHREHPSPFQLDELEAVAQVLGTDLVSILISARKLATKHTAHHTGALRA